VQRDCAGDPGADGGALAESQALDHQPRPRVREKKRRRDRLIGLAASDPDWAVGFEDETWWSRLALPSLYAWSEDGKPPRLVQQSLTRDDPSGALRRPSPATGFICRSLRRCGDVVALRGRPSRERRNDPLPFVVLREARSGGQERVLVLVWDTTLAGT
jgi:hypothetical protein